MLLCVMGCADSSPEPKEVLEKSRKTTEEVSMSVSMNWFNRFAMMA